MSRAWCFTLNNPSQDVASGDLPGWDHQRYRVFQLEQGANGTPHLQGYVVFSVAKSLRRCRRYLSLAHWEPAKAGPEENRRYCTKCEGRLAGPWESGTLPPGQGSRTDLSAACSTLLSGGSLQEVEPSLFVKYHKGLTALLMLHAKPRAAEPRVFWFWGPTGTGKSRLAAELSGASGYWKPPGKWFDGYLCQDWVIIDDLRSEDYPFQFMLRLTDRYPLFVEVKGGFVSFNSPNIIVTAPGPPDYMYQHKSDVDHYDQLTRRITEIREFKNE